MAIEPNHQALRVLLTGDHATELEQSLGEQTGISFIRADDPLGLGLSSVDVAVHVTGGPASHQEPAPTLAPNVPLILAAFGEPNGIIETGLAVGAADVLVLPQPPQTILFALRKAARSQSVRSAKVVTVFSPKGGSGKTVVATNLAVAAAKAGNRSLLIDLDLQFGDAALALALSPRATLSDLVASSGIVDSEKLRAFVTNEDHTGLSVLAAPLRPEDAEVVGHMELKGVLEAAAGAYDAVVIDTGPLFDRAVLGALDHTDQLLLVVNPELTSLKNVRLALDTIDRLGFPRQRVSLLANRIGAVGAISRAEVEEALNAEIAYEIPDDPAVPAAINRAIPVVATHPSSRFAKAIEILMTEVFGGGETSDEMTKRRERRLIWRRR
jgi:Flp pilus assembly CpaE family ATPase